MSELSQALNKVRKRITRHQGKNVNEQNTKTSLIDPILRALGWDVGDLDQVQQEYKRRKRDKPVDYALFLFREPRLFVEAKALGQNLSDRKWANQIMGYATVAGVEWVVITNGDEYRIYNALAPVPIEEKLFRKVCLSNNDSPTEETLSLLSKEQMSEKIIEILWKAHFVDRQIRNTLNNLFSSEPDDSLVRLVTKRVKELNRKDVIASLRRVQVQFDFPVMPEPISLGTKTGRSASAKKAWATRRQRSSAKDKAAKSGKKRVGVSLKDLIAAGLLKPPLKLTTSYKGHDLEAELRHDGTILFQGKNYKTCSMAGDFARGTITGHRMSTNGWVFWQYRDEEGELVPLDAARQVFLKRKAK